MKIFKRTNKTLNNLGKTLRKGLQDELKFQKHNATGALSRGLKYNVVKKGISTLNVTSSVSYWKAVNNPAFARVPNLQTILKWMKQRNIPNSVRIAIKILGRLENEGHSNRAYPDNNMKNPYRYWTKGNSIPRRTNFSGYVVNKFKKKIIEELSPSIGKDIGDMIAKQIRKNNPKTNVVKAF